MTRNHRTSITLVVLVLQAVFVAACARAQYPESTFPARSVPEWSRTVSWEKLSDDAAGDSRPRGGADGKAFWFHHDKATDTLWFKLEVYGDLDTTTAAVSVSFDLDGEQGNGLNWYGTNSAFTFDKMISVGLVRRSGDSHTGYNGFSQAGDVAIGRYLTGKLGTIAFIADREGKAYIIGVARADLGRHTDRIRVIGSVGRNATWNDDLMDKGFATITVGKVAGP